MQPNTNSLSMVKHNQLRCVQHSTQLAMCAHSLLIQQLLMERRTEGGGRTPDDPTFPSSGHALCGVWHPFEFYFPAGVPGSGIVYASADRRLIRAVGKQGFVC